MNNSLKAILIMLLLTNPAKAAGWEKVASTLNDDSVFYIASESIKKSGSHRIVWEVVNYSDPGAGGFKSIKVEHEYDCAQSRVRILYGTTHSELFAKGKVLFVLPKTPSAWRSFHQETIAHIIQQRVCQ
jgi:hypothetical protein